MSSVGFFRRDLITSNSKLYTEALARLELTNRSPVPERGFKNPTRYYNLAMTFLALGAISDFLTVLSLFYSYDKDPVKAAAQKETIESFVSMTKFSSLGFYMSYQLCDSVSKYFYGVIAQEERIQNAITTATESDALPGLEQLVPAEADTPGPTIGNIPPLTPF
jgi:hypothetical protein